MALGKKTGGRSKGTPNRATAAKASAIAASGLTPLDYMLSVLRDEANSPEMRLDAANKAAPFVHPRLAAIEHSGGLTLSHEDALDELDDDEPGKGDPPPAP
jgi:hypothetical protein